MPGFFFTHDQLVRKGTPSNAVTSVGAVMCDRAGAMCSAVRKSFVLDQNSGQNLSGASALQVGTKLEVAAAPGAARCHSRQGIKESWSACSGGPVIFLLSVPTSAHTEVPKSPSWLVPRSLELPRRTSCSQAALPRGVHA